MTQPPLTPAPTPVYIYTDNFTKPGGWYNTSNDKYQSGYPTAGQAPGYYVTLKAANLALYSLDKSFGDALDFIMQVDATALSDLPGYYGVAFRMVEQTTNRYEFLVSYQQGAYILRKRVDATSTVLIPWKVSSLIKKGANQTNRLMVEVRDNEFTLYANGYLLDKYTDKQDTLRIGILRVMSVSADKPNVSFVYNNFGMKSPP